MRNVMKPSDAPMPARYTIRRDALGWSVIDVFTGQVACRDNVTLTGFSSRKKADDLAKALSWLYRKARRD